ncbi:MAG: glycoside hydrolase family 127 protein [Bacteroidaceae bacterium]|nr:glycoside hydrolase family 127 protein [Bacteroidaceae bacterium]
MKPIFFGALLLFSAGAQAQDYPIKPVPFTSVHVASESFWGQRLQASRDITIPLAFSKCESEGRYRNFELAAKALSGQDTRDVKVKGYSFDDTDVYKTIEGASYLLQTYPDKKLEAYVDSVVAIMAKAQEPDGYLYTARTMNPAHPHEWSGAKRWEKVEELSHEFYNLGHMVEGAVAHYQATGKRNFLDIAIRYADCVCREIGDQPGQQRLVPGHQIAEMALARLYTVTKNKKYLDQARFFLDARGYTSRRDSYSQAHLPVLQQDEAVGHAVRAAYMYAGMADVAALTGDKAYIDAIDRIWDNIVSKKLYITGGIGATASGEAFGDNFELPNMSAYCETCAAIGNVYVNHRLFLLHGESKYYDVLERSLYNGVISGVSLDGGKFFYPNPLESMGQHQRQAWFGCACCPSNICRFIPSIPGYFYQTNNRDLYVNLYGANETSVRLDGKSVKLRQQTHYPADGDVALTITGNQADKFRLRLRIPGWVRGLPVPSGLYSYADDVPQTYSVKVNGQTVEAELEDGYFGIERKWKKGDCVEIHFDMPARTVQATDEVEADRGRVAVTRGPLVYCAEFPDNDFDLGTLLLNQSPQFSATYKADKLCGINELATEAQTLRFADNGKLTTTDVELRLIPYYAWNHRGSGRMLVWIPQQLRCTSPALPPTLASKARLTASTPTASLSAVNDRLVASSADDKTIPYYHWWPKQDAEEWLQYDLAEETVVSQASVYWFDDAPWGGCRVPQSWRIQTRLGNDDWTDVAATEPYAVTRGALCTTRFRPVKASAVRLVVQLPKEHSAGLYEWSIK